MSQWTDNNLSFLLRDYAEAVEMRPGDIAAAIAPANTGATGYLFPVLAPLLCGAASVLLENWSPTAARRAAGERAGDACRRHPDSAGQDAAGGRHRSRDFSAVRVITSAAPR